MRCRNSSMFHQLRLEWCQKIDTNPCQSLALKDVNLRQICRRAMRSGVPMPPWLVRDFPSRMKPLRGGFIVRTSTNAWLKDWALVPYIFLHTFHCPGLSSMFWENGYSHGKLGNKRRSMFENIDVFPRVLVSTCQYMSILISFWDIDGASVESYMSILNLFYFRTLPVETSSWCIPEKNMISERFTSGTSYQKNPLIITISIKKPSPGPR